MRLLHLEDSISDAELISMLIRREWHDCEIRNVQTLPDYRAALAAGGFDLILSDYTLPGFDGLMALELARAYFPAVPFLFLSGTIGEERAVEALKRGATDYILKDRPTRLIPAIRQAFALIEEAEHRRHSDAVVHEQEAHLRAQAMLLDKARDAIIAMDLEHRIAYWNGSAEKLYGWKAAEVFGRRLDELGLGFDAARFAAARNELLARGEWRGDFRLRPKSGEPVLVESTWSLVVENDGRPRSILIIDTDVTERKKLETQLLRAQRMESIGTLAGGVAHDLNNVLTPILLTLDMLALKASTDEDRRLIEKTKTSATHGAALVQQLLAFARGAEGRRTLLDPAQALPALEPLIRQTLPANVALVVRSVESPARIRADVTQFNQALVNLCINARDAMPGGGRIDVTVRNVAVDPAIARVNPGVQPGPHVCISVTDSGGGISPAIIEKIFDPFFTTKAAGKGTGLGLSVVTGIMKSHGGFVQAESEPGHGASFHLFFPAVAADAFVPAIIGGPPAPVRPRGNAILLVDDEPAVRDTLQLLLQRAGHLVYAAADAGSAVAEYEQRRGEIALLITDMMLPDRPGTEIVKTLRHRDASLPVIAISGMMASGAFDELLHLTPPVECLAKPLSPKVLLEAVRRHLAAVRA